MKPKVYKSVVLGSGISGLSIAWWCRKNKPRDSVLLIDSKKFLEGASAKNAGFLTVGSLNFYNSNLKSKGTYAANEILDFCQENHELLHHEGLLSKDVEYRYAGSYSISSSSLDSSRYQPVIDPGVDLYNNEKAYFYALDGSVSSPKLLRKMRQLLQIDVMFESNVKIDFKGSKLFVGNEPISFQRLFVANNAWFNNLIDIPKIRPVRAQIFRSNPLPRKWDANYYFSDDLVYLRQENDGRLLVGGKRLLDPEAEETFDEGQNKVIQNALLEFARERLDSSLEVEQAWSGIMGFSEDLVPKVGKISDNIFYQTGFSAHGMGMAFHLAKLLCQWALKGKPPKEIPPYFFTI